jgi:hypothetical protein
MSLFIREIEVAEEGGDDNAEVQGVEVVAGQPRGAKSGSLSWR